MKKWKKIFYSISTLIVIHVFVIIFYGFSSNAEKSDLIVILGSKVEENGIPAKRLQYRLNKGIELFKAGKAEKIIVSGGIGIEGFDEAKVMANYLVEKGIPEDKIIQDNQGLNTYLSASNSLEIMEAQNLSSIIIVSQYFHLLRAEMAFRRMGIKPVSVESSDWFFEWRDFYSIGREIIGIYYYLVRSY